MKTIILTGVFLLSAHVFATGEAVPIYQLNGRDKVEFGEPKTECYSSSRGERCYTSRKCTHQYFHAIGGSDTYFALEEDVRIEYLGEKEAFDNPRYCRGEPDSQLVKIYRKSNSGYIGIGEIAGGGCSLSADEIYALNNGNILRTSCHFTGTGNMVEEKLHYIAGEVREIQIDRASIDIPDLPLQLGEHRFEVKDDRIILRYVAHPRHCQCVASYSIDLALTDSGNGSYSLSYIDGSYRPQFTSLSNARNQKGLKYYQKGEMDAAIREFKEAQGLDVTNYEPVSNLALAYLKVGELDKAIKYSTDVFENAGDKIKANAAYNLGKAYEKQGDLEQSLKYYRTANDISPSAARKKAVDRILTSMNANQ